MSKYKRSYTVKLRMAHYISYSLFDDSYYMDNRSNSRANTCIKPRLLEGVYLLDGNQCGVTRYLVIHNNSRIDRKIDTSYKFLPYQLWMVGYWPTMALTGNGELGFDSGEGA
jgi:hypothetical protein